MRLAKEAVSPGVLLAEVRDGVKGIADDAGVEIVLDVSSDLAPISADHARLRLAISNLATNAIRHAPRGSAVRLRVRAAQDGVRFEVDDAGPGVPVGERERIFEPFVRGSNEKSEGAGLGLTIAREVVRAHGGRIGVTEADGGGARFWVEVPGR